SVVSTRVVAIPPVALIAGPGRPADAGGEQYQHRRRGDPPGVHPGHAERVCGGEGEYDADGDSPIVTDEEVVPESGEALQTGDHDDAFDRSRRAAASITATQPYSRTSTTIARSAPGQLTPAPSAPQKVPNAHNMTPTTNFIVFSGTRDSGARTAAPTPATTRMAINAATAATGTSWALAPNVRAMNTTSRPSRTTLLNTTVKPYQSGTRPRPPADADCAAASC